ncbi:MAG TPA: glycosyltransferase, partial [Puia sp.]
ELADREVPRSYGVEPGEYLLLMARMEEENNIEMILKGFTDSGTDKKILIIGNIDNRFGRYLKERYGRDDRIIFTGAIFEKDTVHSLKYYSSLYFHGHSTGGTNPSLLEAMASRALIFAHDNAFNRNVLGDDAYYFSSAGDITLFVEGFEGGIKEKEMRLRNYEKIVGGFNWPSIITKYERYIRQSLFAFRNERNILYRRYSRQ